ncbi:hypothetical protein MKS88_003450 [Plasmodium brasilianum]|uniref:Uncharacterized protein n=1 Tax=Plasmodium brasilianum TaxID=5824 RepID=A0ACB9Y9S3_PLABR|nr:hypothetical protein MKS88_003450 [Plasmodium brasilianum]
MNGSVKFFILVKKPKFKLYIWACYISIAWYLDNMNDALRTLDSGTNILLSYLENETKNIHFQKFFLKIKMIIQKMKEIFMTKNMLVNVNLMTKIIQEMQHISHIDDFLEEALKVWVSLGGLGIA